MNTSVSEEDLNLAIVNVVKQLNGIEMLYPSQINLLKCLIERSNVFYTSPTNSGKTLGKFSM